MLHHPPFEESNLSSCTPLLFFFIPLANCITKHLAITYRFSSFTFLRFLVLRCSSEPTIEIFRREITRVHPISYLCRGESSNRRSVSLDNWLRPSIGGAASLTRKYRNVGVRFKVTRPKRAPKRGSEEETHDDTPPLIAQPIYYTRRNTRSMRHSRDTRNPGMHMYRDKYASSRETPDSA